jgi:hypothetical protein
MSATGSEAYPLPQPTTFTRPFWEACQNRQLGVAVCRNCGHRFMPGAPNCPQCWSGDPDFQSVSGRGEVVSFAVYRRTYHPAIPAPYVVALVQLEEGPRMISNIVECAPEAVAIGIRVEVCFQSEAGFLLPRFVPVGTGSTDPSISSPART